MSDLSITQNPESELQSTRKSDEESPMWWAALDELRISNMNDFAPAIGTRIANPFARDSRI